MTLENFTNLIKEEVTKRIGEDEVCKIHKIIKNNDTEMIGLNITRQKVNIAPTIYLNNFYDEYMKDTLTIEEIVSEIVKLNEEHKIKQSVDMTEIMDFENVRERIIFKLVNTKRNEKFLEDVPHIEICDLSIFFQYLVAEENESSSYITIHYMHQELWSLSIEEMYKLSLINTPKLKKVCLFNMRDLLCNLAEANKEELEPLVNKMPFPYPMYVLSNQNRIAGAGVILYPGVLKKFAEAIEDDFYIIPSSIDEVILFPAKLEIETDYMIDMIKEINEKELSPEIVLSDSLYFYKKSEDKFEIVEAGQIQKMA